MSHAYICDAIRTPIGRYGGALAGVRTDDLAAIPIRALMARHPGLDWAALGFTPLPVADTPGLVVARTVAMLINEAADAVRQGVCTPEGADAAMKLGVNYPAGPFEWLARWGAPGVAGVLDALDTLYRGERYRLSPGLRQRARALP